MMRSSDSSFVRTKKLRTAALKQSVGSELISQKITGQTSGATGIVRGKYSTTQAYIEETNQGNFQIGERIVGQDSRVSANVTAYHRQALNASRNVKTFQDVDKAPLGFVELFRTEFLQGVPKGALGNKANMLKHIKDFYRAKGNESSFQFILIKAQALKPVQEKNNSI